MTEPLCFDCEHFAPGGTGRNDLREDQWDDGLEGECHRHPPTLGVELTDRHGDRFRHFGEWPKVCAGDWCSAFQPRRRTGSGRGSATSVTTCGSGRNCGACAGGMRNVKQGLMAINLASESP